MAGSVVKEFIDSRASHTHDMFLHDKNRVYDTTPYSFTLAGFSELRMEEVFGWPSLLSMLGVISGKRNAGSIGISSQRTSGKGQRI